MCIDQKPDADAPEIETLEQILIRGTGLRANKCKAKMKLVSLDIYGSHCSSQYVRKNKLHPR